MLLGIGYLPRLTGPNLWQSFDAAEIGDDLAHIAELGFQAVRVPLFWEDFQPSPEHINPRALDHFGAFLQIAAERGLKVVAGLWTGMWDGVLWWPDWGMTPAPLPPSWPLMVNKNRARWGRIRHPFTDQRMLAARALLVHELVSYFGGHPALHGWEPLPGFGRLAAASERGAVLDWLSSSIERLDEAAPTCTNTCLLALDALETPAAIWPDQIIAAGANPSLSIATFASDRRRLPLSRRWLAFALDLAATLAAQPISMHLAGLPTAPAAEPSQGAGGIFYANEEDAAAYLADVIAIARSRHCPELWLWRWADIPEAQWKQAPYDQATWRRHTGLLRGDGSLKEVAEGLSATSTETFPTLEFDPNEYRHDPAAQAAKLWAEYQAVSS